MHASYCFWCIAAAAQSLPSCLTPVIPWTTVRQAPVSMEFSRQGYWSGLPSPAPRNLPYPWIKPTSPVSPAFQENSFTAEIQGKPLVTLPPCVKKEDFISLIDFNCMSVYC